MKQCSNECNQIMSGKRFREEEGLPYIVKQSQNVFVLDRSKYVFLNISQYSQEHTSGGVYFNKVSRLQL